MIGDVNDRDVIMVDDEVDTGGSIAQAVEVVKSNGAARCVSGIHPSRSFHGMPRKGWQSCPSSHIITTDTVSIPAEKMKLLEERLTVLSIAPMVGEVIRRAHEGRSVGEMFNE